jgi:hypothetical protein
VHHLGELAFESVSQRAEPDGVEVVSQLDAAHSDLELIEFL